MPKVYRLREVLEVAGISRRTLRIYEEIGFVTPAGPVENEERFPSYPEEAVETILRIQRLRRDLGVNLAGIEVILGMRRRIEELQRDVDELVEFVRSDLRSEIEGALRRAEKPIVPRPETKPPRAMGR